MCTDSRVKFDDRRAEAVKIGFSYISGVKNVDWGRAMTKRREVQYLGEGEVLWLIEKSQLDRVARESVKTIRPVELGSRTPSRAVASAITVFKRINCRLNYAPSGFMDANVKGF